MRYLLLSLMLVLAGCSGEDKQAEAARKAEYDAGTKYGESMVGKCLKEWTGEHYVLEKYEPAGWVSVCYVGKVCDYKDKDKCIMNKVCSQHMHGSWLFGLMKQKTYTEIDCKEIK